MVERPERLTLNLSHRGLREGDGPLDVVTKALREDRVQVEHGTPLEAGALPARGGADQDVREQD